MRRTLLAIISTVVGLVMLLSFKTPGSRSDRLTALAGSSAATSAVPTAPAALPPTRAGAAKTPMPQAATRRTVNGRTIDTQYGPVQLQVSFVGRRIVNVTPLQLPSGQDQSNQIDSYAVPILNQEALRGQSARIDSVSGASYTSDGYAQSLQSAIDLAGL